MTNRATIQTDGASRGNPGPAAIGGVILDGDGRVLAQVSEAIGVTTNNVAEYKALLATLAEARDMGLKMVDVRLDSELIVKQVQGRYRTKKPELQKLLSQIMHLLRTFDGYTIRHVPRAQNALADSLANRALDAR